MITIGLTGNRYSGKDKISNLFREIRIPVFDADTILKFIIGHELDISKEIRKEVGVNIFTNGVINPLLIKGRDMMDDIIDCAESKLMDAYDKFNSKNNAHIYTIFHSSILFERSWNEVMDYNINVYCPKVTRMDRMREVERLS